MTEVAILKPFWSKRTDGRWGISDLNSITLRPEKGFGPNYFAIDSQLQQLAQTPPANLQNLFLSFGPTEFLLAQSILPIVAWKEGASSIRCIGTAFVVSCTGYIVTAGHVLLDPQESGYGGVIVRDGSLIFPDDLNMGVLISRSPASGVPGFTFFPIEQAWTWGQWKDNPIFGRDDQFASLTDVAICKLPERPGNAAHQPLSLSFNPFEIGETAYAIGYAEMEDIPVEYWAGQMRIGAFAHRLYVSVGEVMTVFPTNHVTRDVPTPGPCFDFQARIPGKMSGAPVFGARGAIVRGVVSRSFSGEKHAYGCMIGPVMALPLDGNRSLLTLKQNGADGIPDVHGAGL